LQQVGHVWKKDQAHAAFGAFDRMNPSPYLTAMSIRPIVKLPDPLLRQVSKPVERFDAELQQLIDDMFETMHDADGLGLAAIQVGVPLRLLVLEIPERDEDADDKRERPAGERIVMINPEVLYKRGEPRTHEEGCLSIPEVRIEIERPGEIGVRYTDRDGKPHTREAAGLLATAIQHELDHLDGKLIIDFLSRLKRDMIVRRFRKQAREEA
jgi:peptide deformylase